MAPILGQKTNQQKRLTREELDEQHGADPDDLAAVEAFARQSALSVVESDAARRSVVLSGNVENFNKAFGVKLQQFEHDGATFRARTGEIFVPSILKDVVVGVFGLTDHGFFRPHLAHAGFTTRASTNSHTPQQLAKLYNFPADVDGTGQCIGIIELGGGFRRKDIHAYFDRLGLPVPKVKSISVDHGLNHPTGSPGGPDGEVMLDIEVAAGVAPGATIAVYFAPNTLQGFLDALTTAVHDKKNRPSVISISWGGQESQPEVNWIQQFDEALQAAASIGVTVCCASGDDGAADDRASTWDGRAHVDFPASSPFALACGGTRLASSNGSITLETVWNGNGVFNDSFGASGGGVSDFFDLPPWQAAAGVPPSVNHGARKGRGVPDVAGVADPATGYDVIVDGQLIQGFGGTSAVAPLWAGLIALMNQSLGRDVGYLNPTLYGLPASAEALNDIKRGDNKVAAGGAGTKIGYGAKAGWDPCTGLGSPNGAKLLAALK